MKRRNILVVASACLVLLMAFGIFRGTRRDSIRFARYVESPIPRSVTRIQTESNDLFGVMPEPVVRISFSATTNDLAGIVAAGGFAKASGDAAGWFATRGNLGWWSATPLDDGSQLFFRSGRRGEEYLRIDDSGTNAFYLLWGI